MGAAWFRQVNGTVFDESMFFTVSAGVLQNGRLSTT
jgi:hypothetical protein